LLDVTHVALALAVEVLNTELSIKHLNTPQIEENYQDAEMICS
jgi:hypothetical protein